ncbi:hypothetical protein TVAG_043550 [Trichomonas vaginalis G3]|uniref:Pyridoxal phosphate homeostasis protein n=1 Tax=Trichomonas vaginalis (strain ATCC PRA-98 / G3) TaxID=412133 RepID=A2EV95_TRIV3|nr:pyridoxal phosphate binding [Trichomonas vaginalis G3]EAY03409.1 hypothetical protein TVAG_043550 [Trichomonas vaginalis G3]KAI5540187.1 pyridoxal phosphate binding [Trichomonas vaginalis G3]|eukprot:XP_001315632.1 hypothetical protein [Trichomonas vaginalis G3]
MTESHVAENYKHINEIVKNLSSTAHLVCVSKTKPIEDLKQVFEAGGRIFGENYVDEIITKGPQLPDAQFHMIGHLQSNKVAKLCKVENLVMIQSIDSKELATKVDKQYVNRKPLEVLIQINTSAEPQKSGIANGAEASELAKFIVENCHNLKFRGVMTIGETGEASRDFACLVEERRRIAGELGMKPEDLELSMGMSADYELALKMGATFVRVGSSIFGPRIYPNKK